MDQEPKQQNGKRLLVIDEDKQVGPLLKTLLETSGYEVTLASTGAEAMKNLRRDGRDFDLVITDQVLPDLSGFEIINELRKIKGEIPIIMCSGSYPFNTPDYQSAGIRDYLIKPFGSDQLLKTVARHLAA
jgi:DNA-binding response OmpR family regulator